MIVKWYTGKECIAFQQHLSTRDFYLWCIYFVILLKRVPSIPWVVYYTVYTYQFSYTSYSYKLRRLFRFECVQNCVFLWRFVFVIEDSNVSLYTLTQHELRHYNSLSNLYVLSITKTGKLQTSNRD